MELDFVRSRFIKHFDGSTGQIFTSPGRINLIGEHTDYNGGFVFPGAIDKGVMAEIKPNGSDKVRAYSIDLKDYVEFGLGPDDAPRTTWAKYIYGVCREMIARGVDSIRPSPGIFRSEPACPLRQPWKAPMLLP